MRNSDTQLAAIWLRDMAYDGGKWEETGCSTKQMTQKNTTYLIEEQDGTGRYEKHHKKKKTTLDGTRDEDGGRKTGYTGHKLESRREA